MFREFKVGDLFDGSTGDTDLKKEHLDGQGYPVVTAGVDNLGIAGYSSTNAKVLPANTLTVDMFGNCYFRPFEYKMVTHARVFSLSLKDGQLTPETGLYICTMFNWLRSKYNYSNMCSYNKIKAESIQLPVKPGTDEVNYTEDDIDWAFMESYIHELEESYIHELEESYIHELDAYLKETGLDDYTLTDNEREVLEREPVFKEFEVIDLFDVINTKSIRQSDVRDQLQSDSGSTPYITASDKNNAIFAYIDCPQEWIDEGNCIFIGGKTTTVTYQSQDFCSNDSHNLALYLKNEEARTESIQLYLVSILKKAFANKYQWSNALSKTKIKNESIQLPVKPGTDELNYTEDDIDWDYMTSYARVMEKQVIADVVDYKNEVIATTKKLVKKEETLD